MEPTAESLAILIADDHPVFRKGLTQVIEAEPGLRVVAEAADGAAAFDAIRAARPDVAVLDIEMPKMGGFQVARALREHELVVPIIFLTMYKDQKMFDMALDLGAKGYLLKDSAVDDIAAAIRAVAEGQHYFSPLTSSFLVDRLRRTDTSDQKDLLSELTPTERRVLRAISSGKTSKEIAAELFISIRTVENHRANICTKLGVRGSHALVRFAIENRDKLR
jgi:DNA-binding NarL/FixJ family response regulator